MPERDVQDEFLDAMNDSALRLLKSEVDQPTLVAAAIDQTLWLLIENGATEKFEQLGRRATHRLFFRLYPDSEWHDYPEIPPALQEGR